MLVHRCVVIGLVCLVTSSSPAPAPPSTDPFGFWRPTVNITEADRRQLNRGEPLARIVPAPDREVAIFAALPVSVDGDRLVAWVQQIAALKKSRYVEAIGRFSDPPQLDDLVGLLLDERDLLAIARCVPGDCGLKLARAEMEELKAVVNQSDLEWRNRLQDAFRHLVLRRVQQYRTGGHAALPPYESTDKLVSLDASFAAILEHSEFLTGHLPQLAEFLARYPHAPPMDGITSFFYWSKERFNGKPIVRATHVTILRGTDSRLPDALVVGKEIFATHYFHASLGVTAILRGETGPPNYLAYLNRSDVDLVRGPVSFFVRWTIQKRLKSESASVLRVLQQRLESGDPQLSE